MISWGLWGVSLSCWRVFVLFCLSMKLKYKCLIYQLICGAFRLWWIGGEETMQALMRLHKQSTWWLMPCSLLRHSREPWCHPLERWLWKMFWNTSCPSSAAKLPLMRTMLGSGSVRRYSEYWSALRHNIWLSPPSCLLAMLSTGGQECSNKCRPVKKRWTGWTSRRGSWRSIFQTQRNMLWRRSFLHSSMVINRCRPTSIISSTWRDSTRKRSQRSGAAVSLREARFYSQIPSATTDPGVSSSGGTGQDCGRVRDCTRSGRKDT